MSHHIITILLLSLCSARLARIVPVEENEDYRPEQNSFVIYSVSVLSSLLLLNLFKKSVLMPLISQGEWKTDSEDKKD